MKYLKGEKTFCLASSGHVAGVINPPQAGKYNYKLNKNLNVDAAQWLTDSEEFSGSWWKCWTQWLSRNSEGKEKSINYESLSSLEPAPGSYVK